MTQWKIGPELFLPIKILHSLPWRLKSTFYEKKHMGHKYAWMGEWKNIIWKCHPKTLTFLLTFVVNNHFFFIYFQVTFMPLCMEKLLPSGKCSNQSLLFHYFFVLEFNSYTEEIKKNMYPVPNNIGTFLIPKY